MRFHSLPVALAAGHVLAHNVSRADGRRMLRKGVVLGPTEVDQLRASGRESVYVVELQPGDVREDEAAQRIAEAIAGAQVLSTEGKTGRVNLRTRSAGVVRIDLDRLALLNSIPGVALATLKSESPVRRTSVVASLKIIPYALSGDAVARAEKIGRDPEPILSVSRFEKRNVGLVLSGSPGAREKLLPGFGEALIHRVEGLGSAIEMIRYVVCDRAEDEERELTRAIEEVIDEVDLLLLAGETAIVDPDDVAPRAMAAVGAELAVYGAPVDPGNLIAIAYRGSTPIVGMPGCARSPKSNVVDLILPRLLVGDRLTANDVAELGHGGLLEDVPERGLPRSWID